MLESVASHWQLELGHSGKPYTTETGKPCRAGPVFPLESWISKSALRPLDTGIIYIIFTGTEGEDRVQQSLLINLVTTL